jgi:xanthine dehydrogenase FAD-binding subunit
MRAAAVPAGSTPFAPSLSAAAATVGGAQIQALGTIGGSIGNASPAGDLAPSLLVAETEVVVRSVRGERVIPLRTFWWATASSTSPRMN